MLVNCKKKETKNHFFNSVNVLFKKKKKVSLKNTRSFNYLDKKVNKLKI